MRLVTVGQMRGMARMRHNVLIEVRSRKRLVVSWR